MEEKGGRARRNTIGREKGGGVKEKEEIGRKEDEEAE